MADAQQSQQPQQLPASLADELAQLRATLAAQQQELTAQRELIAQQQADIATLRSASDSAAANAEATPAAPRKTSRRNLLVGAAGVAAAATAAVATVAISEPQVAHAATGDNLILGASNDANAVTSLVNTSGAYTNLLSVTATLSGGIQAIVGSSFAGTGAGITPGASKHAAYPGSGTGFVIDTIGVKGISDAGVGMMGQSASFLDLVASGTGRIWQVPQSQVGAPTAPGTYFAGESIRDVNGDLWLCTGYDASYNPVWVKVAHLAPGITSGGAVNYLSKPIRLLDTRNGPPALNQPKAPYANPSTHTITVSGVSYNGVDVPASGVGAIGNLTIIGGSGDGGYVALVPSGAGFTGTANIAYVAGQVVSNSYNVGLSATGALDIILGGGTSGADVILDLFAVVS